MSIAKAITLPTLATLEVVTDAVTHIPGFLFVDHIAIAVPSGELDSQVEAYRRIGFREVHREEVYGANQVRESLLQIGDGPNLIQLLEPLVPESPIQKLIDRNGGRAGFAHVALRVRDAKAAFDSLRGAGVELVDKAPQKGSRGTTIFFIHPKAFGCLIEVVEA